MKYPCFRGANVITNPPAQPDTQQPSVMHCTRQGKRWDRSIKMEYPPTKNIRFPRPFFLPPTYKQQTWSTCQRGENTTGDVSSVYRWFFFPKRFVAILLSYLSNSKKIAYIYTHTKHLPTLSFNSRKCGEVISIMTCTFCVQALNQASQVSVSPRVKRTSEKL